MTDEVSWQEAKAEEDGDDLETIREAQPRQSTPVSYWSEAREEAGAKLTDMDSSSHPMLGVATRPLVDHEYPRYGHPTGFPIPAGQPHPESDVVQALRSEDSVREKQRLEEEASEKLEQARVDSANELAVAHNQALTQAFRMVAHLLNKANNAFVEGQYDVAKSLVQQSKEILGIFEQGLA